MRLKSDVNIKNRRATFDYTILDRYTAGIQLYVSANDAFDSRMDLISVPYS